MIISRGPARPSTLPRLLAFAAALAGAAAWIVFFRSGLVLSHYDARAHLVVARRVFDNLTPGWQQIGAVWLPLPHLIDLLPAQVDFLYRTGLFASLVSITCLAVTSYAAARLVLRVTGSGLGACICTALLVLNPNLLYLHTTPMTEPLLLATTALAVLWLLEWVEDPGFGIRDSGFGVPPTLAAALFAAMWTRYEAWAVIGAALLAAGYATWRRGAPIDTLLRRGWRLTIWPVLAVAIFVVNSRITVGAWFVSDGFYVLDPSYADRPMRTLVGIWWGTHQLSGYAIETIALAAAVAIAWRAFALKEDSALLITLALFATAVVPIVAFYQGHPYRIRYMIPVVAACAVFCGLAVGLVERAFDLGHRGHREHRVQKNLTDLGVSVAKTLAVVLLGSILVESPLWNMQAPMLLEAQWDRGASLGRRDVTACLAREYSGDKVLASMGSLAHYMHELSNSGFAIADFINEGNGEIWNLALQTGPAPHAGWMLVEEVAEGGDVLAERVRRDPAFTRGMMRVCEGGGVALYRRAVMQNSKLPTTSQNASLR